MADVQDPKYLNKIIKALIGGIDATDVKPAVMIDLHKFVADYDGCDKDGKYIGNGRLAEMMPKWKDQVLDKLGTDLSDNDKDFINSPVFKAFDEKTVYHPFRRNNMDVLVKYSKNIETLVNDGKPLTPEGAKSDVVKLLDILDINRSQTKGAFDSLEKKLPELAPAKVAPVVPPAGAVVPPAGAVVPPAGAVVPPAGAVVPPAGTTPPVTPPKEPWEIKLDSQKAVAAGLFKNADKALTHIDQCAHATPSKTNMGAGEILDSLNYKSQQAEKLEEELLEEERVNEADGIHSLNENEIANSIAYVSGAQIGIVKIHSGLTATHNKINVIKQQINNINSEADAHKMQGLIDTLNDHVLTIKGGQKDAEAILKDAATNAIDAVRVLESDNAFSSRFKGNHDSGFHMMKEGLETIEGKHGLAGDMLLGGPNGAPAKLKGMLKAAWGGATGIWDSMNDYAIRGTTTEKGRLWAKGGMGLVAGLGILLIANPIRQMMFGESNIAKWTVGLGIAGFVLNYMGVLGQKQANAAEAKMDRYARTESSYGRRNHTPDAIPVKPRSGGSNNTNGRNDNADETAETQGRIPVIKDKNGNIIKNIVVVYNKEMVTTQDANGGTPRIQPAFFIKMPGKDEILNVDPKIRDAIKDAIDDKLRNGIVAKLAGSGQYLDKDMQTYSGNATVDKINGIEKGEDAIQAHFIVGRGVVNDFVDEQLEATQPGATGS